MKVSKTLWISIGILFVLGLAAANVLSSPEWEWLRPRWIDARVIRILTAPIFHLGAMPVTMSFLMKAIVFLILLGFAAGTVRRILQNRLLNHTLLDTGQQYAYSRITAYFVFLFGMVIGLESAGVNLNSLLGCGRSGRHRNWPWTCRRWRIILFQVWSCLLKGR